MRLTNTCAALGASAVRRFAGTACLALAFFALSLALPPAVASAQDADRVLKAMYDYIASQKSISITYDTDIEVVTASQQKLQFASSGTALLSRPDKLRVTRSGGYADVEFVFDGKQATIAGKNLNVFAQRDASGTVEQLVSRVRDEFGTDLPGADLLAANGYDEMMKDATEISHIGHGVIGGVECNHLAFRNDDADWQLWVEIGDRPIPRKYVITNKSLAGAPQYTIRVTDWKTNVPIADDAFAFKPAADMKKIDVSAVMDIDEVPHGTPTSKKTASGAAK